MERVPYARFCTEELLYLLYSFLRKDATGKQQSVLWEQDGVTYLISGYDTGLDAQTMFDMAAELVK